MRIVGAGDGDRIGSTLLSAAGRGVKLKPQAGAEAGAAARGVHRVENVEEIVDTVLRGKGEPDGIALTRKPLARNLAEAKRVVGLAKSAGLKHGYVENRVF